VPHFQIIHYLLVDSVSGTVKLMYSRNCLSHATIPVSMGKKWHLSYGRTPFSVSC